MLPANVVSTHTVFCLKIRSRRPVAVVPARTDEQPGRELSRAAERDDARHGSADVAPAGAASRTTRRTSIDSSPFRKRLAATGIEATPLGLRRAQRDRGGSLRDLSDRAYAFILDSFPLVPSTLRATACPLSRTGHGGSEARKRNIESKCSSRTTSRQNHRLRDRRSSRRWARPCRAVSIRAAMAIEMTDSGT